MCLLYEVSGAALYKLYRLCISLPRFLLRNVLYEVILDCTYEYVNDTYVPFDFKYRTCTRCYFVYWQNCVNTTDYDDQVKRHVTSRISLCVNNILCIAKMAMEKLYAVRDTHTRSLTALGINPSRREILIGCEGLNDICMFCSCKVLLQIPSFFTWRCNKYTASTC